MLTPSRSFRRRADTVSDLILVALALALSFGFFAQLWEPHDAARADRYASQPSPEPAPAHASEGPGLRLELRPVDS